MANVWYIGDSQVREITLNGSTFSWSIWNGWSIPESAFTSGQLAELDADPGFLLGQTGPRTLPPWSPDSTVGRESVYLQQMKAIYDEVPSRLSKAALDGTYAPAAPTTAITYNPDGSVATVTENGITTTYTYNTDGTVATDTRLGVTRTYTYDGSGNLTGIAS
ncbi:minor tail protein [Gordonia phage Zany]|uniref:Minor tail protein n=1 Tax=Gordonia phage Zany TaxID=2910759 RepID=A0AA49BR06_9CAUD|nr:minor tail protein [Gordonia phage Zany]